VCAALRKWELNENRENVGNNFASLRETLVSDVPTVFGAVNEEGGRYSVCFKLQLYTGGQGWTLLPSILCMSPLSAMTP